MNFKNITIEYHYLELPAPFSYTKTLKMSLNGEFVKVDYSLEYSDREEFSNEELEDEGFSREDGESWSGNLHKDWLKPVEHLCGLEKGEKAGSPNECMVTVDENTIETYGNEHKWDYFIQEITQAIYETAGWENPLVIRYCKKASEKAPIQHLKVSFTDRNAKRNAASPVEKEIAWESVQTLLELYYLQEFKEGEHSNKVPNQPGIYTDPSDGLWYNIESSSSNLNKKQKDRLLSLLNEVFE
ncbi:MAG: hypothetical protein H7259_01330 [Cytophagales bacterium]|nr:hypothetical protein [Cytophaga sp.]